MITTHEWLRHEHVRRQRNYRRWLRLARRAVLELA